MSYDESVIPVCDKCSGDDDVLKGCKKCGIHFCSHYASNTDIRYCSNCMTDIKVTESIVVKTLSYDDGLGNIKYIRRQMAKDIKIEGKDWLFAEAQVMNMSDEDLIRSIEYHRALAGEMLAEREARKVERIRKLAQLQSKVTLNHKAKEQAEIDADRAGTLYKGKSSIKNAKTSVTNKDNSIDPAQAAALLQKLVKSGFTPEMLKSLLVR